jgi:hypothetical protein
MRRQEKKQALDIELFSSIADTPGNHIPFLSTTAAVNVSPACRRYEYSREIVANLSRLNRYNRITVANEGLLPRREMGGGRGSPEGGRNVSPAPE